MTDLTENMLQIVLALKIIGYAIGILGIIAFGIVAIIIARDNAKKKKSND